MLPILPIYAAASAAAKNWKLIVGGLAAIVLCAIIGVGYHHYTRLVAENKILAANAATLEATLSTEKATNKATSDALARWKAAESAARKKVEEYAKVLEAAKAERRSVDALKNQNLTTDQLAGLSSISRLLRMFACAADGREDCGDNAP